MLLVEEHPSTMHEITLQTACTMMHLHLKLCLDNGGAHSTAIGSARAVLILRRRKRLSHLFQFRRHRRASRLQWRSLGHW